MHPLAHTPFFLLPLAAACGSSPPVLPDGAGRGVLHADAAPPPGAPTWDRPQWRVGDRFVLARGVRSRGEFRVVADQDGAYVLDTGAGVLLRRDHDLGNLGEWSPQGAPLHLLSPADARYHWPLWVGKRWSCEFVDRTPGGAAMTMLADYVVEDVDTVSVPAGTFAALRIVRTLQLVGAGPYLQRAQIAWYAPDAGTEVRQLVGDTLVELVELERRR